MRSLRSSFVVAPIAAALFSCGASQPPPPHIAPRGMAVMTPPPETPAPGAPDPQPNGRLPDVARAAHYALTLDVDPSHDRYGGSVAIDVRVARATRGIVLHGRGLTIRSATITPAGQPSIAATTAFRDAAGTRGEPEELVLSTEHNIPAGDARIDIAFDREYEHGLRGLYRVRAGNDWYAYTQMEPNDARRAFPCFDEPSSKVPWDVTIHAPSGALAIANMPETSHAAEGDHVTYRFATTPPMPSYLIAVAVGPFDVVQGATGPVPIRAITTRGQGGLTHSILDAAAAHVRILADYFGRAYPYPKLDLVAVPEFGAGAMENPGMITFREELMLLDPQHASTSTRRAMASVTAHELAHQWFGDLVTMAWWNDLWLNEGFATWAQARVVDTWQPSFGAAVEAVRARGWAMETDALPAARAVRQPVNSTSEAMEAFDGITYVKGAAVLRMLELWLGEDTFRTGVRDYIHAHEWGNAAANDLLDALGHASNRDVTSVAATFLDQPGVPVVDANVECPHGAAPTVTLTQSQYHVPRAGESSEAPASQRRWDIPVCLSFEADGGPHRTCTLLHEATQTVPLEGATRCPRWVDPNAEEAGYYRYTLTPLVRAVASRANAQHLEVRDRVGFLDNAWAMVRGARLGADDYLRVLDGFRGERDRVVIETIVGALDEIWDNAADDAARPRVGVWVASYLRPIARELGWDARPGDDDERRLLRRSVLQALGNIGDDRATLREAERRAEAYFHDPHSVEPEVASIAVPLASRHASGDRLDAILAALAHPPTPADRVTLDAALASFDDPVLLRRALDATLTDVIRVQDVLRVIYTAGNDPVRRPTVVAWVHEHFDAIRNRIPDEAAGHLAGMVGFMCTTDDIASEGAFWRTRIASIEGAERTLREGTERAEQCVALRDREHSRLAAYLAHPRP